MTTLVRMKKVLLPALLFYMVACGKARQDSAVDSEGNGSLLAKGSVKHRQYLVEGKRLYIQYCSNCHQADGRGLGKVYPPIDKSDYIDQNFEETLCIVKNGREGEIVVNGITYNQVMMPIPNLTDLEIAEISTFIYNSWGRDRGLISVKEIQKILRDCQ